MKPKQTVRPNPYRTNLENMMVYPNPAKEADEELTFARLTAEAQINIYSLDLRLVKQLKTADKNGGVKWDMRDDAGRILPSGVYWYHATGKMIMERRNSE